MNEEQPDEVSARLFTFARRVSIALRFGRAVSTELPCYSLLQWPVLHVVVALDLECLTPDAIPDISSWSHGARGPRRAKPDGTSMDVVCADFGLKITGEAELTVMCITDTLLVVRVKITPRRSLLPTLYSSFICEICHNFQLQFRNHSIHLESSLRNTMIV